MPCQGVQLHPSHLGAVYKTRASFLERKHKGVTALAEITGRHPRQGQRPRNIRQPYRPVAAEGGAGGQEPLHMGMDALEVPAWILAPSVVAVTKGT